MTKSHETKAVFEAILYKMTVTAGNDHFKKRYSSKIKGKIIDSFDRIDFIRLWLIKTLSLHVQLWASFIHNCWVYIEQLHKDTKTGSKIFRFHLHPILKQLNNTQLHSVTEYIKINHFPSFVTARNSLHTRQKKSHTVFKKERKCTQLCLHQERNQL